MQNIPSKHNALGTWRGYTAAELAAMDTPALLALIGTDQKRIRELDSECRYAQGWIKTHCLRPEHHATRNELHRAVAELARRQQAQPQGA